MALTWSVPASQPHDLQSRGLGVYTPSAVHAKAILTYKTEIATMNAHIYIELNTHFWVASAAGSLTQLLDADWIRLNATFADAAKSVKAVADPAKVGIVRPAIYLGDLKKATVHRAHPGPE